MVLWHELCLSKSGVDGDLNGKPWTFNQFCQYFKHNPGLSDIVWLSKSVRNFHPLRMGASLG